MQTKLWKFIAGSVLFLGIGLQRALAKLPEPTGTGESFGRGRRLRIDGLFDNGMPGVEQLEWLRDGNSILVAAGVVLLMVLLWLWQTRKGGGFLKMLVGFSVFALAMVALIGFI